MEEEQVCESSTAIPSDDNVPVRIIEDLTTSQVVATIITLVLKLALIVNVPC
jgi:hypothetical protein